MKAAIKDGLFESLKTQFNTTIGALTTSNHCMIDNLDVYKITSLSYKLLNGLTQTYSDLISEIIASPYDYSYTTLFILDTKFIAWKAWLESVSALLRFYIIDPSINGQMPKTILKLLDFTKESYTETLLNVKTKTEKSRKLISDFLRIHEETYNVFYSCIKNGLIEPPSDNSLFIFNLLQNLASELTLWMQYTTFEVLSLDRLSFGDKTILIGSSVVTIALSYNLNLVKQFIMNGFIPDGLRYTQPNLKCYDYLFSPLLKTNYSAQGA